MKSGGKYAVLSTYSICGFAVRILRKLPVSSGIGLNMKLLS